MLQIRIICITDRLKFHKNRIRVKETYHEQDVKFAYCNSTYNFISNIEIEELEKFQDKYLKKVNVHIHRSKFKNHT